MIEGLLGLQEYLVLPVLLVVGKVKRASQESQAKEVNQAKMERLANRESQVCLVILGTLVNQEGMVKRAKRVILAHLDLPDL